LGIELDESVVGATDMKRIGIFIATLAILSLLLPPPALAQPGRGRGSQYQRMYNPQTVETLRGEVVGIENIPSKQGSSGGIHLRVKTQTEEISVHLGPAWDLDTQDIKIELKDNIELKGSRVTFAGQPALIAAQVTKGDRVLVLRDRDGTPVWRGWQRELR
jgi:hypothetical protein